MEIELERTFLLKEVPKDLKNCKSVEILDIYFPTTIRHPILRLRKKDNVFEITKKAPIKKTDASEQYEKTISLSKEEFLGLSKLPGKKSRKIRYYYPVNKEVAEISVFLDDLEGLALVDFEFSSIEEKANFSPPSFCLTDVTQEEFLAGGFLAGKKYSEIKSFLDRYNYQRIN